MFLGEIEKGGNGTVSKYQSNDESIIAIKEIKSTYDGVNESAIKEIHSYHILKGCSNIVQLINIKIINSDIRLVMPYYPHDLNWYINNSLFIERIQYLETIVSQLLDILAILYQNNIIHGDIKPKNILIDENMKIYLADFGAARFNCKIYCGGLGTPIYESPELQRGTSIYVDKIDIWASGITILEYLLGKHVFDATSFGIDVKKILVSQLDIDKFMLIPNSIINLLDKMLIANPVDRVSIVELIPSVIQDPIKIIKSTVDQDTIDYSKNIGRRFKFSDITIATAIELYDKYSNGKDIILTTYGCIAISSKLHEICSPEFEDYVFVSGGSFTVDDLKDIEVRLLKFIYNI